MAQLKDLIVNGASRFIGDILANKAQLTSLHVPTSAGGTTYGAGTSGQVLKTNGTSVYWAADNDSGGTVTSVRVQATSPVVSSVNTAQTGTLNTTISLADGYGDTKNPYASKTKNYVLAAPSDANGAPSFRALVAADIPTLSITDKTSGTLTIARGGTEATTAAGAWENIVQPGGTIDNLTTFKKGISIGTSSGEAGNCQIKFQRTSGPNYLWAPYQNGNHGVWIAVNGLVDNTPQTYTGGQSDNTRLKIQSDAVITVPSFYPSASNAVNCGLDDNRWKESYAVSGYFGGTNAAAGGVYLRTNSTQYARFFVNQVGTESATGETYLTLGNSTASGTANNAMGYIRIYGDKTKYHQISPTSNTANYTHYLPNATGWMVIAGDGTSTGAGSSSQPVYINANGVATAITNLTLSGLSGYSNDIRADLNIATAHLGTNTSNNLCVLTSIGNIEIRPNETLTGNTYSTNHRFCFENLTFYANGTTNTYSLGTSSKRWKELFIGTANSYGSTKKPIYWNAGVPAEISYTIEKSVPSNAVFTDTATAADNILDGSNSGTAITYAPYSSQQSKLSFDTSTTNPTRTDRLNLNGYFYATKIYSDGEEIITKAVTIRDWTVNS